MSQHGFSICSCLALILFCPFLHFLSLFALFFGPFFCSYDLILFVFYFSWPRSFCKPVNIDVKSCLSTKNNPWHHLLKGFAFFLASTILWHHLFLVDKHALTSVLTGLQKERAKKNKRVIIIDHKNRKRYSKK